MGKRIEHKEGDLINGYKLIKEIPKKGKQRRGLFECPHCGEELEVDIHLLRLGLQRSCGCLRRVVRNPYYRTKLYMLWYKIQYRCYNEKSDSYHNYGGRGIKMHEPWLKNSIDFIEYCMTLDSWDDKTLSLDRINPDGNYEPGNLRFATQQVQVRNKRKNGSISSTGYYHVYKKAHGGEFAKMYYSQFIIDGRSIRVGSYSTAFEAAEASDRYIIDNDLEGYNLQIL